MSVTVGVKLVGILKQQSPGYSPDGLHVVLPDQSQVEDLVRTLGIPMEMVGLATVNQQRLDGPLELKDGDQVLLLPPLVAGG